MTYRQIKRQQYCNITGGLPSGHHTLDSFLLKKWYKVGSTRLWLNLSGLLGKNPPTNMLTQRMEKILYKIIYLLLISYLLLIYKDSSRDQIELQNWWIFRRIVSQRNEGWVYSNYCNSSFSLKKKSVLFSESMFSFKHKWFMSISINVHQCPSMTV